MLTRRAFCAGLAAGAAVRAFGAGPSSCRLRLGIVSDVHVKAGDTGFNSVARVERVFRMFRARGADAVVIPGDIATDGMENSFAEVMSAWDAVFPKGRGADGEPVERVFIYGNHDGRECSGATWTRFFGEEYAPIRMRTVKGYRFVCADWRHEDESAAFVRAHRDELAGTRPFFHVQHRPLKDTIFGPWAWDHDSGAVGAALAEFPNAVSLTGHAHYTLADERNVWQGEFTAIGCASLSFTGVASGEFMPVGFENYRCDMLRMGERRDEAVEGAKMMRRFMGPPQFLFLSVYDDALVVERFLLEKDKVRKMGSDWTIPWPADGSFAFDRRRELLPPPAAAQVLSVRSGEVRNRRGETFAARIVSLAGEPPPGACGRIRHWEVFARSPEGRTLAMKRVANPCFTRLPDGRPLEVPFAGLPSDTVFTAVARDCWGRGTE